MQIRKTLNQRLVHVLVGVTAVFSIGACQQGFEGQLDPLPDDTTTEKYDPSLNKPESDALASQFVEPNYTSTEQSTILAQYQHLDPSHLIDTRLLAKAVLYFHRNKAALKKTSVMTVIDFSLSSRQKRFFVVDMKTGAVFATNTAHGKGSDANNDGVADTFSNTPNSLMSSVGAYITAETYSGNYGYSLRLDGVSPTNSNARARAIVVHGAYYVSTAAVQQGRSWGCPAVAMDQRTKIIDAIKEGSLIFAGTSKTLPPVTATPKPTATPVPPTPTPSPTRTPASTPTATPVPTAVPTATPTATPAIPALWEPSSYAKGNGALWTQHAYNVVAKDGARLITGTSDITSFCPKYATLTLNKKISFWVYLVSAMTKYESGFNPASRYHETDMGTDPVTKEPVYSEGLLQLSYQDKLAYPTLCTEFDWAKDKLLSRTDPNKTILSPYKNLTCGIRILNYLVGKKNLIAFSSGHYWSVLMTSHSNSKVTQIKALTSATSICK